MHIDSYPMLFRIVNPSAQKMTHCGVMEFDAPEGCIYLPNWMMRMLELKEEEFAFMKKVDLKKGVLVKFQPHFTKFTELSNPRAVLEKAMRNFSCLTKGDTICIHHGDMIYPIDITEVSPDGPGHAISVVDTDLKVDFDEPKDYNEYMEQKRKEKEFLDAMPLLSQPLQAQTSITESPFFSEELPANKSSPKNPYFQKLGSSGYKLKDKTPAQDSKIAEDAQAPAASGPATPQAETISVIQGKWKYIYEMDPKTKKRGKLIKRVEAKSGGFQAFSGKGNTLQ
jgi:hypothetical protein